MSVCAHCGGTGVAKSPTTAEQITEALTRSCACGAKKGQPCRNTVKPGTPLPGRTVHFARLGKR